MKKIFEEQPTLWQSLNDVKLHTIALRLKEYNVLFTLMLLSFIFCLFEILMMELCSLPGSSNANCCYYMKTFFLENSWEIALFEINDFWEMLETDVAIYCVFGWHVGRRSYLMSLCYLMPASPAQSMIIAKPLKKLSNTQPCIMSVPNVICEHTL